MTASKLSHALGSLPACRIKFAVGTAAGLLLQSPESVALIAFRTAFTSPSNK